jgi:purine-nucleoside phosphorylase
VLSLHECDGRRVAFLHGRIHEYKGYDLSEVQLQVRTVAAWGVRNVVITTAAGAVAEDLALGDVVIVGDVLDLQHPAADGRPARLLATRTELGDALARAGARRSGRRGSGGRSIRRGVHASLPGPQYETPAELAVLRAMGATAVSMSPSAEVRAAHDAGVHLAVLAVVANSGETSHEEVLGGAARAGKTLAIAIEAILEALGPPRASHAGLRGP